MVLVCTTPQISNCAIWHSSQWSVLTNTRYLFLVCLLAYCVLTNNVRVVAWFKLTFRGGIHMNLLRYCELKILEVVSVVLVVAVLFDSDSKEEEFTGFNIEPRFQRNNHKLGSNHTKDGKNYNGELLTVYCCVIYF